MNKKTRNLLLLFLPFLGMILLNELFRPTISETRFRRKSITNESLTVINSADPLLGKCSWICHNSTNYCKTNHVKWATNYFQYTDPLYFGTIGLLHSTGNYGLANIFFFVVLFPAFLFFLIVRSIDMQGEINQLKQKNI